MKRPSRWVRLKVLSIILTIILSVAGNGIKSSFAGTPTCDFFNPITDVCWWCIFPIRIGGIKISLGFNNIDYSDVSSPICICMKPLPRIGLTVSFWEAARLAETTFKPWAFPDFCLDMGISSVPKGGAGSSNVVNKGRYAWNVHWITYPVTEMLSVLTDFVCLEHSGLDIGYISELDPGWNDDFTGAFLYPEELLLANTVSEYACIPDRSLTAAKQFGIESLFWCAGNWGTTYPFSKNISVSADKIESSALSVAKINAMLHRNLVAPLTIGASAMCGFNVSFTFPKKQYKYQLAKPIRGAQCMPVGEDETWWSEFKEPLTRDTYHTFVIWRKRDCCAF